MKVYRVDQVVMRGRKIEKVYQGTRLFRHRQEAERYAMRSVDADRETGEYCTGYKVVEV